MTATDELRKLLDKRGVKYKSHYLYTSWYADMRLHVAKDNMNGTLTVDNLTPEQAIAATLGSDREAELEALAKDLYENAVEFNFKGWMPYYRGRFAALGIEVEQ